jgi:hypothetical protein
LRVEAEAAECAMLEAEREKFLLDR